MATRNNNNSSNPGNDDSSGSGGAQAHRSGSEVSHTATIQLQSQLATAHHTIARLAAALGAAAAPILATADADVNSAATDVWRVDGKRSALARQNDPLRYFDRVRLIVFFGRLIVS